MVVYYTILTDIFIDCRCLRTPEIKLKYIKSMSYLVLLLTCASVLRRNYRSANLGPSILWIMLFISFFEHTSDNLAH